jgi:acetyltransferase-like isoleucine patch superfamily enzyme
MTKSVKLKVQEHLEYFLLKASRGLSSRVRVAFYRLLGMKLGVRNRIEGGGRARRCSLIEIGSNNSFTQGAWLWPIEDHHDEIRIRIGSNNYFNRNLMLDACGMIEIGDDNMFGPDVYVTDSNHQHEIGLSPQALPMDIGMVRIGSRCWIGAKVVILKDVELGDGCVVAAGSVVTRSVKPGEIVAGVPARPMSRAEKIVASADRS